jgi:hypothetical protein
MKNKTIELNVDSIGGQNKPLTEKEKQVISTFFKRLKENRKHKKEPNKLETKQHSA